MHDAAAFSDHDVGVDLRIAAMNQMKVTANLRLSIDDKACRQLQSKVHCAIRLRNELPDDWILNLLAPNTNSIHSHRPEGRITPRGIVTAVVLA